MNLVFATNNSKKLTEAKEILPVQIQVISLRDIHFDEEIIENADTFEGNAYIKAKTIFDRFSRPCFADDSGLVVPSLGGLPGVKSARYANEIGAVDHVANNQKLLSALDGFQDRYAYFITVICLIVPDGIPRYFEGRVEGSINLEPRGHQGFGYDPVFIPLNYQQTFAELGPEIKNQISHRALALRHMNDFLTTNL